MQKCCNKLSVVDVKKFYNKASSQAFNLCSLNLVTHLIKDIVFPSSGDEEWFYFGNPKQFRVKISFRHKCLQFHQISLATVTFVAHYWNLSDICQIKLNKSIKINLHINDNLLNIKYDLIYTLHNEFKKQFHIDISPRKQS